MTNNTSSYNVFWVEFTPSKGIVTKHDQKVLGTVHPLGKSPKTYRKHVGTKEQGFAFIESVRGKLDKSYTCRFFTDKQHAMTTATEGYAIHYTEKQLAETISL